jgi:hypothetical protein
MQLVNIRFSISKKLRIEENNERRVKFVSDNVILEQVRNFGYLGSGTGNEGSASLNANGGKN